MNSCLRTPDVDTGLAPVTVIPAPDVVGLASQPYQLSPRHNLHDSFPGKRRREPPIGRGAGDYGDRIKREHSQRHNPPDVEMPLEDKSGKLTDDAPEILSISRPSSSGGLRDPNLSPLEGRSQKLTVDSPESQFPSRAPVHGGLRGPSPSPLKDRFQNLTLNGPEGRSLPPTPLMSGGLRHPSLSPFKDGVQNPTVDGPERKSPFLPSMTEGLRDPNSSVSGPGIPTITLNEDLLGSKQAEKFLRVPSPNSSEYRSGDAGQRSEGLSPIKNIYGARNPSPEGVRGVPTGPVLLEMLIGARNPTISMERHSKWKDPPTSPPFPGAWNENMPPEPQPRAGSRTDKLDYYSDKPSNTGDDNDNPREDAGKDLKLGADSGVDNGPAPDLLVDGKDDNPWRDDTPPFLHQSKRRFREHHLGA